MVCSKNQLLTVSSSQFYLSYSKQKRFKWNHCTDMGIWHVTILFMGHDLEEDKNLKLVLCAFQTIIKVQNRFPLK